MFCRDLSQDKVTFIKQIKAGAVKEIRKKKRELKKAIKEFFLGKQSKAFQQTLAIGGNWKEHKNPQVQSQTNLSW